MESSDTEAGEPFHTGKNSRCRLLSHGCSRLCVIARTRLCVLPVSECSHSALLCGEVKCSCFWHRQLQPDERRNNSRFSSSMGQHSVFLLTSSLILIGVFYFFPVNIVNRVVYFSYLRTRVKACVFRLRVACKHTGLIKRAVRFYILKKRATTTTIIIIK